MQNVSLFLNRTTFGNPANSGNVMTVVDAKKLLDDWVKNEKLKVHMKQVAHLMEAFAASKKLEELEVQKWYLSGLLHDADWDQWPANTAGRL